MRKDGHKTHLAVLCRGGRRCTAYTFVSGHLQTQTAKNLAYVCLRKRRAQHALYAVQRLCLGHQLDEAQIFCHEFKETSRLEVEDEKSFAEKEAERCFLGEFFRYYCYCFFVSGVRQWADNSMEASPWMIIFFDWD